ncbi:MAG: hypothetical protein V4695_00380 [Pseudomonadota bacterium]
MNTTEIVIVTQQNTSEAVFVNGVKIYARVLDVRQISSEQSATSVGYALATSLGVSPRLVDVGPLDLSQWIWEDVAPLTNLGAPAPTDSKTVAVQDEITVGLYWDRRCYGDHANANAVPRSAFNMRLQDDRVHAGKLTVSTSDITKTEANTLCATMVIDRIPGNREDTQSIHITANDGTEALVIFKQANGYLLLPPSGSILRQTVVEDHLPAYSIN